MPPKSIAALLLLIAAACESESAYVPYVPAPGFEEVMEASLELPDSGSVVVGEWITLHASRRSGPWMLRDSSHTEEPLCEKISPVVEEREVAEKVEWRVEPEGAASFRVTGQPDFARRISFARPGLYRVRAVSSGCGAEFESNVVEVEVR